MCLIEKKKNNNPFSFKGSEKFHFQTKLFSLATPTESGQKHRHLLIHYITKYIFLFGHRLDNDMEHDNNNEPVDGNLQIQNVV